MERVKMSNEKLINVVLQGALGRMGCEILATLCQEANLNPLAAIDKMAKGESLDLPNGSSIPISTEIDDVPGTTDVLVDVTKSEGAQKAISKLAPKGVNIVVGSSGIPESTYMEAEYLSKKHNVGIVIVPNFALGGVLMSHIARLISKYYDYADLTETHHEKKIDAPSGTAIAIAKAISEGKGVSMNYAPTENETIAHTRGGQYSGVNIHSVRLPGRVAHHELVFAGPGETLTIRHDSIDRSGFMPGVVSAIHAAVNRPGLTVGLEQILDI